MLPQLSSELQLISHLHGVKCGFFYISCETHLVFHQHSSIVLVVSVGQNKVLNVRRSSSICIYTVNMLQSFIQTVLCKQVLTVDSI